MYKLKSPSKIVANTTRRGITQNVDPFRDHARNKSVDNDDSELINGPKPVFHSMSKRNAHCQRQQEPITPQHEEIIKYIHESWSAVCIEVEQNTASDGNRSPHSDRTILYYEDDPCPLLQDFKPFDLESWWGKRLYTYITSSVSTKGSNKLSYFLSKLNSFNAILKIKPDEVEISKVDELAYLFFYELLLNLCIVSGILFQL